MRRFLGELLLYWATCLEDLAVRVGDEHTACEFLKAHTDPRALGGDVT